MRGQTSVTSSLDVATNETGEKLPVGIPTKQVNRFHSKPARSDVCVCSVNLNFENFGMMIMIKTMKLISFLFVSKNDNSRNLDNHLLTIYPSY